MGHYILQSEELWFKVCELDAVDGSKYVNYAECNCLADIRWPPASFRETLIKVLLAPDLRCCDRAGKE